MSDVRSSPSGNLVPVSVSLTSVFGRVGNVTAAPDDYDTDQVDNQSSVSGASFTDALETLTGSSSRANESSVTGATLTDALDSLLAGQLPYEPGTMHETFCGGNTTGAVGTSANIGDSSWNIQSIGTVVVGPTCNKVAGSGSTLGVYRLTSPTSAGATPAGWVCFLGNGNPAGQGPLRWDQLSECTWKARFDTTPSGVNVFCMVGFQDAADPLLQCGFMVTISGPGNNLHYQVVAVNTSLGGFVFTPTTVLVDTSFHDFRIVRTNATTVTYFIDGVQVGQINNALAVPAANQVVIPMFKAVALSSGAQSTNFVEVDDFVLIPVAA